MQTLDTKPWYKQFWPWFVIALPATAVVASLTTMWIAVSGADSMVVDNYYKEGLAINQQIDSDKRAAELGLSADVTIDNLSGELIVDLHGAGQAAPAQLELSLHHPADSEKDADFTVKLTPTGKYIGDLEHSLEYRWYVQVQDPAADPKWRLRGEIDLRNTTTVALSASQH